MNEIISISTLAYDGYDLETALEQISHCGAGYVEMSAVEGVSKHITPSNFQNDLFKRRVNTMMERFHLSSIAFSTGTDLSNEGIIPFFEEQMKFAKNLNIKTVHAFFGPLERINTFHANMKSVDKLAKSMDLIVALEPETQEDIVSGTSGIDIMNKINSENIKINYDFVNVFHSTRGKVDLQDDFKSKLDYIAHLHLKDTARKGGTWYFTQIGKGIMDYREIFRILKESQKKLPVCIELPLRLEIEENEVRIPRKTRPPLEIEQINEIVSNSLSYIKNLFESV